MKLSVIIPTHNPHAGRLERTLAGLRAQTLPISEWELVIVDNASSEALTGRWDLSWHPSGRFVREETLGLTHARLRGLSESRGPVCVLVDDDNVLDPKYLESAIGIAKRHGRVGVFGGRSLPEYETALPAWFEAIHGPLAIVDHGDADQLVAAAEFQQSREFPKVAPVGAGMCIRTDVFQRWAEEIASHEARRALDRRGASLASGGDNDIVLSVLEQGYDVGYFPELSLTHIMPAGRLTKDYHARLLEASNRTWVMTLGVHGISPWSPIRPWTLGLRKARAAVRMKPWSGDVAYLQWKAACGQLAGRSDLWTFQHGRGSQRAGMLGNDCGRRGPALQADS
jgi:glycosyltransferase involved in cell wall biosynthesis